MRILPGSPPSQMGEVRQPDGGGGGGGDAFFLVLLDPVGGDVDNEGAGRGAGPVWRGAGRDGPKAPGVESGANR